MNIGHRITPPLPANPLAERAADKANRLGRLRVQINVQAWLNRHGLELSPLALRELHAAIDLEQPT